ncbi:2-hydroxyacyl-CoA dehydratase family protein [Brevundimonas subvibrioides]|uniref:2-hydroxyglutaryl-CoA dehydratase D-component n=1 Tax=Brevundimonas subvibrioides (strain ATCC 15264 / DSM 4735 / LMG 14903 / NBRC 16000 / CB 81) TaxID=633149 RepID=D9QKR3_BRESC|nr:2-hydroxyacyl-CoA dehydratase family protein [Brevundimonas subvibrioides]ADL01727.1 2-hydroxyglutaryl-CoA dehydratase D-component [Brevundimonas subvibrioides ATCC 15264]
MQISDIIAEAMAACAAPSSDAVACLGSDAPRELIVAAGLVPWAIIPDSDAGTGAHPGLSRRSQGILATIEADGFTPRGLVLTHAAAEDAQLFAVLRELHRTGRGPSVPFAFVDLLHGGDDAVRRYNLARLATFQTWLEQSVGHPVSAEALDTARRRENALKARLAALFSAARSGSTPRLSGADALDLVRVISRVPGAAADRILDSVEMDLAASPVLAGQRIMLTGSPHETSSLYSQIESLGAIIVAEDHGWGDPWLAATLDETVSVAEAIATRSQSPDWPSPMQSADRRAAALAARAQALSVDAVIHGGLADEEAAPWDIKPTRQALEPTGIAFLAVAALDPTAVLAAEAAERIAHFLASGEVRAPTPKVAAPRPSLPSKPVEREARRSRKSLDCTADFGAWQRDWFAGVREQAADGPFAVVNADAPQEILRALDIPYVVNQWWASIVAAKQKAGPYGRLLKAADYPSHVETYSAQGLAAALDDQLEDAPWGGLPTPSTLSLIAGSDPGPKIFEAWARETGADLFVFDRSIESRIDLPIDWWDDMPERWEQTLEPERLELMAAQIEQQIARLEALTGRTLDRARLVEVMNLVNEQEDFYRRTRDLIARTYPVPVGVVDTMPATMVPQWHRGTAWARDAARRFYEEVARRAAAGEAACPGERLRLMWVGRGLWSDTGFYQRWEESHGAVFVWSMYLGLAADGYLRSFEGEHDVIRALAARFVTMGDELRMPTWSGAWHVKEARTHGCHGAVAIDDADPLVLEALERAGVPVLRIALNNMGAGNDAVDAEIAAFLDTLEARKSPVHEAEMTTRRL